MGLNASAPPLPMAFEYLCAGRRQALPGTSVSEGHYKPIHTSDRGAFRSDCLQG